MNAFAAIAPVLNHGLNKAVSPRLVARDGTRVARPATESSLPMVISGLTVAYDGQPVVFSADMTAPEGTMTAIVGPNGAGKSSFLKGALGIVPAIAGEARFFGRPAAEARGEVAYVPQRASVDWGFPARSVDVVTMGLYRRRGLFRPFTRSDRARAMAALARVGMESFAERQIGQLSGGQQQRVFLARALAQDARLYLLDEPFAGVDAATEKAIIQVLQDLVAEGRTVVAVHHDLTTVADYFDRVVLINRRVVAEGTVADTFSERALQEAYGGRLASSQLAALAATG